MVNVLKKGVSVLLVVLLLLTSAPLQGLANMDFLGMFSVSAVPPTIKVVKPIF